MALRSNPAAVLEVGGIFSRTVQGGVSKGRDKMIHKIWKDRVVCPKFGHPACQKFTCQVKPLMFERGNYYVKIVNELIVLKLFQLSNFVLFIAWLAAAPCLVRNSRIPNLGQGMWTSGMQLYRAEFQIRIRAIVEGLIIILDNIY